MSILRKIINPCCQMGASNRATLTTPATYRQAGGLRHSIVQALPGEACHIQQPGVAQRLASGITATVQQQAAVAVLLQ